jgi:hypothetical protein
VVAAVPVAPFIKALAVRAPGVRLQAVTGPGRLGHPEVAAALLARTTDSDPAVAHVAVQAVRWLRAKACALRPGAGQQRRAPASRRAGACSRPGPNLR